MTSPGARRLGLALVMALAVVAVDQVTKGWAVSRLSPGPCTPETCIDVVGSLRFRLHYNRGASFSTGQGLGPWFGVLAVVMSVYLLRLAARSPGRAGTLVLGALAGGAVGNLVDRIFRAEDGPLSGPVVDFIDLQWWPIFNIADMAIVSGVIAVLVTSLRTSDEVDSDEVDSDEVDSDEVDDPSRGELSPSERFPS